MGLSWVYSEEACVLNAYVIACSTGNMEANVLLQKYAALLG
jgi:hypothetical protein